MARGDWTWSGAYEPPGELGTGTGVSRAKFVHAVFGVIYRYNTAQI